MGQYRISISLGFKAILGFSYSRGLAISLFILCFSISYGLTDNAKGFHFYIEH